MTLKLNFCAFLCVFVSKKTKVTIFSLSFLGWKTNIDFCLFVFLFYCFFKSNRKKNIELWFHFFFFHTVSFFHIKESTLDSAELPLYDAVSTLFLAHISFLSDSFIFLLQFSLQFFCVLGNFQYFCYWFIYSFYNDLYLIIENCYVCCHYSKVCVTSRVTIVKKKITKEEKGLKSSSLMIDWKHHQLEDRRKAC